MHPLDEPRAERGFTLVEVLIAIVLVGILSAVVVVGVGSLTSKGSTAGCAASLDAARVAVSAHTVSSGSAPASLAAMQASGSLQLPAGVTIDSGGRRATTPGWQLVMVPGASPSFTCSSDTAGLPLDLLPAPAEVGLATRRLSLAYTGPAMKVRRSSDDTLADIGFTAAGTLDTTALTTFVGSGSGYVHTWYDQSGNGRNLVFVATRQPRIVDAGVVESAPRFGYDGVTEGRIGGASEYPLGTVWFAGSSDRGAAFTTFDIVVFHRGNDGPPAVNYGLNGGPGGTTLTTAWFSNGRTYVNGAGTGATTDFAPLGQTKVVSATVDPITTTWNVGNLYGNWWLGPFRELIISGSVASASTRQALEGNIAAAHGVTLP